MELPDSPAGNYRDRVVQKVIAKITGRTENVKIAQICLYNLFSCINILDPNE